MGASATETQRYNCDLDTLREAANLALVQSGATGIVWLAGGCQVNAKTGFNFLSWGEKLEITLTPDGTVTVKSKCAMPTQIIDWGKNRENVNSIMRFIHSRLSPTIRCIRCGFVMPQTRETYFCGGCGGPLKLVT